MQTALGRTLGVLALSAAPPRPPLGAEQLRVTEVFAGLAALALERTELLEREARRAEAEELLHKAAQLMTASLDLDAVYAAIVEQAARLASVPTAMLLRLDDVTQTLRCVASIGRDRAPRQPSLRGRRGDDRRRRRGRRAVRQPRRGPRRASCRGSPRRACARSSHVPLELGPRRFGVLTVCHPGRGRARRRRAWRCSSRSRAPAAAAIANALEFQHERRIASALTRGFIPDAPPELEGFSLGLVYEPVGQEVSGGDVFGVWRQPDGALAVLVGDVSGKGIEVAAVSAMVRFFIEARTWDADCPAAGARPGQRDPAPAAARRGRDGDGVSRRHRRRRAALRQRRPRAAARRRRRAAAAEGGDDVELHELPTTGLPLGVEDDVVFEMRELAFGPGALLFASTDGLVEARRAGELFGQDRLSALVAANARRLGPQALVELAYAEAAAFADELTDDVAIIALRPAG